MKRTILLALCLIFMSANLAHANPTITVGWSERHRSATFTAEYVSWRDDSQMYTRLLPVGSQTTVQLVTPRESLATVPSLGVAKWMQRVFLHNWPTRITRHSDSYSLMLIGRRRAIPWPAGRTYVPWRPGDREQVLALTFPEGDTEYTGDISFAISGPRELVRVGDAAFRGAVVFNPNAQRLLTSINVLSLEEYLQGVVPNEMPASWPLDALKAQALAARTYAIRQLGKHARDGFDLCSAVHCQAYHAASSEHPRTNRAVQETRGEVITHGGRVIDAVYHAHAGGHTRNSKHVWGGVVPYLKAVPIPEEPAYSWTRRVTMRELERRLRNRGIRAALITNVAIARYADAGHVSEVRLESLTGVRDVQASVMRSALDGMLMRSTKFDILLFDGYLLPHRPPLSRNPFALELGRLGGVFGSLLPKPPAYVEFVGSGYGHGVGMSQWGAFGLAQTGTNYKGIIRRFYTGVTINKLW